MSQGRDMSTDALIQEAKSHSPPPVGGDRVAGSDNVPVVGVQLPPEAEAASLPQKKLSESDFVIIPSYSKWFDWNNLHDCEVRSLPEFFDGTSAFKNPGLYKYLRNSIIKKYRANPTMRITFTEVRRTLVGDVYSIRRVFDFLDTWGLINYPLSSKQQQQTLIPRSDDNKDITSAKSIDLAESASSERGKKFCSSCPLSCSIACFVSDRYDLVVCARCYVRGNYPVGINSTEFRRVEITENVKTNWTEKETLHLLEALMHYGENWKRVAEHVGGRTEKDCIARFIKLPFGEQYVDPSKVEDGDLQSGDLIDAEAKMEPSAKKVRLTPLADASNPIMAQSAFLSALAGVEVAEAAAEAAVKALYDNGTGQGVVPSRSIGAIGTGHTLTLHAVEGEEAKTGEAEILLNEEENSVVDIISRITQVQMKEFQDKVYHFEQMELQLEKERQQVDEMRHQLFLDQVALLFHKDKGAASERSGASAILEEETPSIIP